MITNPKQMVASRKSKIDRLVATNSPNSFLDRSQSAAQDAVQEAAAGLKRSLADDVVSGILTDDFIDEVFRLAWRHQFEDNRRNVARKVQQLFLDQIDEVIIRERNP